MFDNTKNVSSFENTSARRVLHNDWQWVGIEVLDV